MCRIVFTRNQKTGLTECSFSFMYRKSQTNANKVHKLIYINNEVQRMSTNMYQQTRALVLQGLRRIKIYIQLQWILAANCLQDSGECMRLSIVATPHVFVNV